MLRKLVLYNFFCLSLLASFSLFGQANVSMDGGVVFFNKNVSEEASLDGKRGGYFKSHIFGDSISYSLDRFYKLYVKYESVGGAYPTETKIIYKQEIYKAVSDIEKVLVKMHKKGEILEEEGESRLSSVLNKAILVRFGDTSDFEFTLSSAKDALKKEIIFNVLTIKSGDN
jgi:hypothetical protein